MVTNYLLVYFYPFNQKLNVWGQRREIFYNKNVHVLVQELLMDLLKFT